MAFKTLTIKEEVYKDLLKAKGKEESFSEFFGRIVAEKTKPDIMKFAGAWKMSDDEFKKIEEAIKEYRKSANKNWEERLKRYGLK